MNPEFLAAVAGFVMITVVVGLARILWGPGDADRVMAAQLLGTGGIASLLLVGVARDLPAAVDVALTLAMLAAFASIAFIKGVTAAQDEDSGEGGFAGMVQNGVWLPPSQFEACFLSLAHTEKDIEKALKAAEIALEKA